MRVHYWSATRKSELLKVEGSSSLTMLSPVSDECSISKRDIFLHEAKTKMARIGQMSVVTTKRNVQSKDISL